MKNKLLLHFHNAGVDNTIVWIETTRNSTTGIVPDMPKEVRETMGKEFTKKSRGFGSVGGAINTNSGCTFTKKDLQFLIDNMPEDSELKICGMNNVNKDKIKKEFSE